MFCFGAILWCDNIENVRCLSINQQESSFSLTQTTTFVSNDTIVIGRLDGTLAIYSAPELSIKNLIILPESTTMVAKVMDNIIVSSYNDHAIAVWQLPGLKLLTIGNFSVENGVANSGVFFERQKEYYLATGHMYGSLILWQLDFRNDSGTIELNFINQRNISIHSGLSPYYALNIRGVQYSNDFDVIVTGGENAKICEITPNNNLTITKCELYSSNAQRGINAISLIDNFLFVANCAVGKNDSNLWLFKLNSNSSFEFLDSVNLVVDTSLSQVFDFSLATVQSEDNTLWFAGTQEAVVWYGNVSSTNKISINNYTVINAYDQCQFGYYVSVYQLQLVAAGGNVFLYSIS